ncbi:hypothetical protein DFJ74DRAFT_468010 [Hyaloraphidium curvatum]|nr:hypothetical protein DFJ74DRAFT_468010 [Hyaloraphidium curvatum]
MRLHALNGAAALFALACAAAVPADAHILMKTPIARGSRYGQGRFWGEGSIDYDLVAPLNPDLGKTYPCGGKPKGPNTATLVAGQDFYVEWEGSATHGGGHCQLSVSYDGGATFVVLDTILGNCLTGGMSRTFRLPSNLPAASSAIFAWSWMNAIGNREYYMNCADVRIVSNTCGPFTGPRLFVAQVQPPVFPEWGFGGYDYRDRVVNGRPPVTVYGDNCGGAPPPAPPPPPPRPPRTTKSISRKSVKAVTLKRKTTKALPFRPSTPAHAPAPGTAT